LSRARAGQDTEELVPENVRRKPGFQPPSETEKAQGLGGALLADARDRAARAKIAAFVALMVDAKNEAAAAFYRHRGLIALPDSSLTLFLPLSTVPRS
jgi:hypothetical protein